MSTSDDIRALAAKGMKVADIARELGVRYQHAYNVLKRNGVLPAPKAKPAPQAGHAAGQNSVERESVVTGGAKPRTALTVRRLLRSGFARSGQFVLDKSGKPRPTADLPDAQGVYAFAIAGTVVYVGIATMGLARRIALYGRPSKSQLTNVRLHGLIGEELAKNRSVEIYTAIPPGTTWNGLPVSYAAGLELGLIQHFAPTWNMRGKPRTERARP